MFIKYLYIEFNFDENNVYINTFVFMGRNK